MDSENESNQIDNKEEFPYMVYIMLSILLTFSFFSMLIFRRFHMNEMFLLQSSATLPTPAPSALIEKVFNPFFLQIYDDKNNKENVILSLTSHKSCLIHIAWGPKISNIYPLIHSHWNLFANKEFLTDNLQQLALSYEEIKLDLSKEEERPSLAKTYILKRPSLQLGAPPRDRYPLVVILIDDGLVGTVGEIQATNDIGALIAFIHLKDEQCPANTHIFDQYVKTHSGKLHNIKPVYVATTDGPMETTSSSSSSSPSSSSSSSPPSSSINNTNPTGCLTANDDNDMITDNDDSRCNRVCSVCLSNQINRVLLPCRHACMCDICCDKLLYCPMCRTVITSTFNLNCK